MLFTDLHGNASVTCTRGCGVHCDKGSTHLPQEIATINSAPKQNLMEICSVTASLLL